MTILPRAFYARDVLQVARALLGKKLVRRINDAEVSGIIVETEAYRGEADSACHAHRGKTPRNAIMYGQAGHAYVYFTYGMHHLINVVTAAIGEPQAVLLRALVPLTGIGEMETRRKRQGAQLTDGPAKLCQALGIDKSFYGWDLTLGEELWIEDWKPLPAKSILSTPRIGIDYAQKIDREAQWRFICKAASFG
jgi:DNA-3-methyladenine glycosylase